MNLTLDVLCLVVTAVRVAKGHTYEPGAMLRLALVLGFAWLIADDLHDIWNVSYMEFGDYGSFLRTGMFKIILLIGLVLDLARAYWRRKHHEWLAKLIKENQ